MRFLNKKEKLGAPTASEQRKSYVENKHWLLIGRAKIVNSIIDEILDSFNVVKMKIETNGPRQYKNSTMPNTNNKLFHADLKGKNCTYVLEWEIVDEENKIALIVGLDTHENFCFAKKLVGNDTMKISSALRKDAKILQHDIHVYIEACEQEGKKASLDRYNNIIERYHLDNDIVTKSRDETKKRLTLQY